ncbi:hypothetical protein PUR49_00470 [Streptomyces sp. BE147]|uniref:hypothetical protein n=1 Tax=Streptomyces sp. BE147 TaxID=3002524 RepID=UPI002E75FCC7|nr:hypothetical protein [Streptomyces sp. BE147]MEE1735045.1 hypothetical protein [Streptomyces sp. BE147]
MSFDAAEAVPVRTAWSSRARTGTVDSHGEHRIAMTAAVLAACAAEGESLITGWDAVATSYPGFAADLVRLTGARVEPAVEE